MSNFVIITDSACDIKPSLLEKWEVPYINMSFRIEGEDREYSNEDMEITDFYNKMRNGAVAKTAAINPDAFAEKFEEILKEGKDILCLAFSSGLSTTYNSARIAADDVLEKYPERKVIVVDSLCASSGQGLFVYLTVEKKNSGADLEETAKYAEDVKGKISHWFTVDDLVYLKRGGRVSSTAALVGAVLGIKPVLHVDDNGKLVSVMKVRGRKAALTALADKFGEFATDKTDGTIFISHADCEAEAKIVAEQINEKFGGKVDVITDIGPVIGAHSGPGTIALFFVGSQR